MSDEMKRPDDQAAAERDSAANVASEHEADAPITEEPQSPQEPVPANQVDKSEGQTEASPSADEAERLPQGSDEGFVESESAGGQGDAPSARAADLPEKEETSEEKPPESTEPVVRPPRDRSQPIELVEDEDEAEEEISKDWYILKVVSNRENSVCDALRKRVKIAGLEEYFGDIIVPTEDVVEYKNGKRKTIKRKLYPGYIVVNMAINDDTWFLVRETPGIGDFTGAAGKPTPMLPHEVERILPRQRGERPSGEDMKVAISFKVNDRVRVKEGNFQNYEGDVESIDEASGRVTVLINVFNRTVPLELEYWQIEAV